MKLKDFLLEEKTDDKDPFWDAGFANKSGFTVEDADPKELSMGIKVEMEHTTDRAMSQRIALDHLAEIPDYYTRLAKMEKEGKDAK